METNNEQFVRQHMVNCRMTLNLFMKLYNQVLDDVTLANLDVLDNQGRTAGTLLEKIDHCSTAFGSDLIVLSPPPLPVLELHVLFHREASSQAMAMCSSLQPFSH